MFHIFEIHYPVGDNEMKTKVAIFKKESDSPSTIDRFNNCCVCYEWVTGDLSGNEAKCASLWAELTF